MVGGTTPFLQAYNRDTPGYLPLNVYASTFTFNPSVSGVFHITNAGNVGIGTTDPGAKLDVTQSINFGSDTGADTRTNSTAKYGYLGSPHYTNAEEPVMNFWNYSDSTQNIISYGGGSSSYNTATMIRWYTAANNTTVTGTERMRIQSDGNVGIGTTAPDRALEINHATGGNLRLTYNDANGTAATYADFLMSAAGVLSITPAGSAPGIVIPALLTINTAAYTWPAAVGAGGTQLTDVAGNGTLSWGAAGSLRVWKDVVRRWDDPSAALQAMMAVSVYDFRYKVGKGTGDATTLYTGVMAEEAPWAMHFGGTVLSPISTFGYSVLAIQALQAQIEDLKTRLAKYESGENNG